MRSVTVRWVGAISLVLAGLAVLFVYRVMRTVPEVRGQDAAPGAVPEPPSETILMPPPVPIPENPDHPDLEAIGERVRWYRERLARDIAAAEAGRFLEKKERNRSVQVALPPTMPNERTSAVLQFGHSNWIGQLWKRVYEDQEQTRQRRELGYTALFYPGPNRVEWIQCRDGREILRYSTNGALQKYSVSSGNHKWYSVTWDEQGNVVSTESRDDSEVIERARQRLREKGFLPIHGRPLDRPRRGPAEAQPPTNSELRPMSATDTSN